MAVPKKRTSKSKKNSRLSHWNRKAIVHAKKALSLAKSAHSDMSKSVLITIGTGSTE